MRTRVRGRHWGQELVLGSRSHLPEHSHLSPYRVWLGTPGGLGRKVAPHLQGSIPGSEGGHWSQLQTEKQATHPHPPTPAPTRVRAAQPSAHGHTKAPEFWGRDWICQRSPLRAVAARGPAGVGGSPEPERGQVTSAGLQTKAFLCGNPRRGQGEGGGRGRGVSPGWAPGPETFYLGAASRGDLRRA